MLEEEEEKKLKLKSHFYLFITENTGFTTPGITK